MAVDYKEIIHLHAEHYTNTEVAAHVQSSRTTVRDVLKLAEEHRLCWPDVQSLSNKEIRQALYPAKAVEESLRLEPDFDYIYRELAVKGVNLTLLWTEYCSKAKELGKIPYMRSQFCDRYRNWAHKTKATMRISHKPGDTMEVDWSGGTIPLYDQNSLVVRKVPLFVAVLSCSLYAYAEPFLDMQSNSWIVAHIHALEYFGGIPRLLVPDNTKTATIKNTRYELTLNRSYADFADYYGMAIVPARGEHPDDKPNAEGSVKFATTWIIAALRDRKFTSYDEMKRAVAQKLDELNNRPFSKRIGCRRKAFLEEEKSFLRPLPAEAYDPAVWLPATKLGNDYMISDGLNKYSVPYTEIGHAVSVRLTRNLVEVFENGERIAVHPRLKEARRDPVVNPDHMPESHRKYLKYTIDEFRRWGDTIGPSVRRTVDYFLDSPIYQKAHAPEQGKKDCYSLLKLADRYGTERLENACGRLLEMTDQPTTRVLAAFLKNGRDRKNTRRKDKEVTDHGNIGLVRGADHYRNIGGDDDHD